MGSVVIERRKFKSAAEPNFAKISIQLINLNYTNFIDKIDKIDLL
ncbi:hypothetical protein M595_1187 [Lyngbya aestuarii BL J]|uniref:Uncharacterized protein n=1 Tax=Lyngbya aestuarii BL J TaxID=1348334 RepID=U7QNX9_9CYAN|nr:hypothetical protein M595_1187 [Lyngbya aestuarii BL J]